MKLDDLKNKKLCFLGLGVENLALIQYIKSQKIDCFITIANMNDPRETERGQKLSNLKNIQWKTGNNYDQNLDQFNIIFRSPGYPLNKLQKSDSSFQIYSPMRLFFDLCPSKNIIGVTGTKGKGTTSSIIYSILKEAGKKVFIGGNIGVAPFSFMEELDKNSFIVLELSSFQLEDMHCSPHIAVFTNFSPEHLAPADPNNPNYHKSLEDYWSAKSNIYTHQGKDDVLVLNHKIESQLTNYKSRNIIRLFKKSTINSKLVGEHNKENIAAAEEVAKILDIDKAIIKKAIANFKGLPYRIELINELAGIKCYNDSFATVPDSAITALKAFPTGKIILLAGGADKGSVFDKLAKEIKERVKYLVLFDGEGSKKIKQELNKINFSSKLYQTAPSMKEAVKTAKEKAEVGDIILLSPACASFGMFNNYKERGNFFNNEVMK